MDDNPLMLPEPARDRDRFLVPVPLYGTSAQLHLPCDMTYQEASKLAAVIMAYAGITPYRASKANG